MNENDHWSEFRDLDAVKARLGFGVASHVVQVGSGRKRGYRLAVKINLPRRQRVLGKVVPGPQSIGSWLRRVFRPRSRDMRDPTSEVFERFVEVQPQPGSEAVMDRFFELPIAIRAALELIQMGCKIEFTPSDLRADVSCLCHPPKLPEPQEVATRLAAIAAPLVARRMIHHRSASNPNI